MFSKEGKKLYRNYYYSLYSFGGNGAKSEFGGAQRAGPDPRLARPTIAAELPWATVVQFHFRSSDMHKTMTSSA